MKKVLVAMSGGVDSSVAAALLKQQGFDVVGVTMEIWPLDSSSTSSEFARGEEKKSCCSVSAVDDAKRVASMLGIPHYTLNFRKLFEDKVIRDFIEEYTNGRTPNPCIRCNEFLKFNALFKKADELGAQSIATGHYARVGVRDQGSGVSRTLMKGIDKTKDQSYVLYMLNQEKLARVLFPLGGLTKKEVRAIAKKLKLPVADKEESQEICFVPNDDYGKYLENNIGSKVKPGPITDISGKVVGEHKGIIYYTIGQRKGLGAFGGRKYVVKIDFKNNSIMIGKKKDVQGTELIAGKISFVSGKAPSGELEVTAKIRYNAKEGGAKLIPMGYDIARVIFYEPQNAITPGQSVVFYDGDEVLGGGIIDEKVG